MKSYVLRLILVLAAYSVCGSASAFKITMNADKGTPGAIAKSNNCQQANESVFTSDSNGTVYTTDEAFSGNQSFELNIEEGHKGFGLLGGIVNFEKCADVGGKRLVKGDEVWVRLRIKFPHGFEFNRNGKNKFLRLRMFDDTGDRLVHQGYNDLYLNDPAGVRPSTDSPFQFIYEGAQEWYRMGQPNDFFKRGEWTTVEYYVRLDDKDASQGGRSLVRVWIDGKLLGETADRRTMNHPDHYMESLYLFTYWDNDGAHKSQKFYVDDLHITSDKPAGKDAQGNAFIGVGNSVPSTASPSQPPQDPTSPPIPPIIRSSN